MKFKLSPSSLNLFKDCPRCFWLQLHKKWKRPSGIFPSLPSGMDKILKIHFDSFRDKGELPPELKENKETKGMKLFGKTEEEKALLKDWRINLRGIQFTDKEGNLLRGAVDNILVKGEELVVLDYKTRGYALKEDTHEHYIDQLTIYSFLLQKNGYKTKDYNFLLFYIPNKVLKSGKVVFDTVLKKIEVDPKRVEKIWKDALKVLNGPVPKKHKEKEHVCEWCVGV